MQFPQAVTRGDKGRGGGNRPKLCRTEGIKMRSVRSGAVPFVGKAEAKRGIGASAANFHMKGLSCSFNSDCTAGSKADLYVLNAAIDDAGIRRGGQGQARADRRRIGRPAAEPLLPAG